LFIFSISKFGIRLVLEHTFVPTVVVEGPVFQADPAPQVAAAVRLTLTAHAIASRGPLHSGLTTRGGFGVGRDPQRILTLRVILFVPGLHVSARDRSMGILLALSASGCSALAFDGLGLIEAGQLVANVFTTFSAPQDILVLFRKRLARPSPVDFFGWVLAGVVA